MKKLKFAKLSNLKPKLILSFVFILLIPSIVIGVRGFLASKGAIETELRSAIEDNISILNLTIDNAIEPKVDDIGNFSKLVNKKMLNKENTDQLEGILAQYIQFHPEVEAIYVGLPDGSLINYPKADLGPDYDATQRPWYQNAMAQTGQASISDPYVSKRNNEVVVAVSQSLGDGSGVVGFDLKLSYLQELTEQIEIGEEGYALLMDKSGNFIVHPDHEPGTKATESFYENFYKDQSGMFEYELNGQPKIMNFTTNNLTGWKIAGNIYTKEIDKAASPILDATLIVIGIAMLIGGVLIYFIIRSIVTPINELKEKAINLSNGDLTETIKVKSTDEIGQLGQAFVDMQDNLISLLRNIEQNAEQVAASAQQLTASSEETSAATQQVSTSIQHVSESAEKQKESVDASVHSLEEISDGAVHIAEFSSKVTELTKDATQHAQEGGESVGKMVNQMEAIQESVLNSHKTIQSLIERSKQIDSILKIITGIADQTNLLSLNASIEAARAGEHGKGFAVVANEVKKLAEQSRESVGDIQEIISAIQNDTENTVTNMTNITKQVENGVEFSNDAVTKFYGIIESLNKVTPQMEEVSATIEQTSAAIQETTARANENAEIAEVNAAASEEVAASAEEQLAAMEEISSSAQSLTEMAEELRILISKFKY
ncbi:methyl-accepting chemotaxis protein [Lysinibacillus composti]|uniref:HAMP domain-containing protein n=1 Tax=Lysinibacillus composti TaxID=720633 RepID=A0A3N9UAW7_9BACI|nr:methyl-accepting chemotaxis protein [Lysinibacillus composti]MBM7609782.1 methyl-accepting chemotaxis protein [Lysinibacillus composti]RQW73561.1 HAMP domain-containing protein [Lysinibacillus composti]